MTLSYEDTILLKDKIKSRINIKDVMLDHGVNLIDHSSGIKGMACCPFHGENHPSFSVDYEKGVYNCFSCHVGGDMFNFISEKHGFSKWKETIDYLCSTYGIEINKDGSLSLEDQARKVSLLTEQKNITNLARHRDEFLRIMIEVYQKIRFCLYLKQADEDFIERVAFPLFRKIDEVIESDRFDFILLEDLSHKLDDKIDYLRRKKIDKV